MSDGDDKALNESDAMQAEGLLKDFISWSRQPTGAMSGYPRFESAEEWQDWFDGGDFIRTNALDLFERLAAKRTGGEAEDGDSV